MLSKKTTQPMDRPHLEQALLSLRPFEQEMIELLPHAAYQTVPGSAEVVQHPPDHRIKRRGYFLQRLAQLVDIRLSDLSQIALAARESPRHDCCFALDLTQAGLVRKAQKMVLLRVAHHGPSPEINNLGLVRVQRQLAGAQAMLDAPQHKFGLHFSLAGHHHIVRVAFERLFLGLISER
mgnify:CR=1 FL=1